MMILFYFMGGALLGFIVGAMLGGRIAARDILREMEAQEILEKARKAGYRG